MDDYAHTLSFNHTSRRHFYSSETLTKHEYGKLGANKFLLAVEPNGIQLELLYTALRAELALQWRARYVEVLPSQILAVSFEHSTNNNWRCLYVIQPDGAWSRRAFYV